MIVVAEEVGMTTRGEMKILSEIIGEYAARKRK